jgi:NAD dependent epimerase/dehydratase family
MLRDVVGRFATACGVTDMERELARGDVMKIVVIGGTGLIGSKVVAKLKQKGHEALAAAPELLAFPGRHDDQVDALTQGLAWGRVRRGEVSWGTVRGMY